MVTTPIVAYEIQKLLGVKLRNNMQNQPNIKFIPLSFISSEQELKRQIANTIVFSYINNIYPQTNLKSYLVSTQYGYTASASETGSHQLVRITDINDGNVNWESVPYCDCALENNYLLKENDILVARTGGTTGKSFLVKSPPDNAVFASYLIRLRVHDEVNIEFIHAFLNSYLYWSQISEMKSGSAQPNVNAEKLKTLLLPKCSFEVQNRIVELLKGSNYAEFPILKQRLGKTLVELERLKEIEIENKTQATLLTKLRQAYLQEAVMGQLTASTTDDAHALLADIKAQKAQLIKEGKLRKEKPLPPIKPEEIPFEIPKNWVWCRLGEICEIKGGKRLPSGFSLQKLPTDYIYLRVSDMANGTISDSDLHYLTEEAYFLLKNYTISETDIYMTIVGGTIGKCGLIPSKYDGAILTENAAKIIPHSVAKEFLLFLFKSDFCQNQFIDKTKQVGVQKMALNRFDKTLIPLPPLSEQQAIVAKVEGLLKKVSALEAENKAQQAELERLMGAVLQESFSTTVFQTVQES